MAQDQEIQQLMARFQAAAPNGLAVQQLEFLVRTAIFKPANQLVAFLLQAAADQIDAAYQPKLGQHRKGRETIQVEGIFGCFLLQRDYYYHPGKKQGHYPADAALGLEGACTPALAKLICWEGADQSSDPPGYRRHPRGRPANPARGAGGWSPSPESRPAR